MGDTEKLSNTLLSELIRYVLFRKSLNFCSCTSWFLDLDDLVKINRTWLYKELKSQSYKKQVSSERRVLDLESEARVQSLIGVSFCYWHFLFSRSKASDANIGSIANFGSFEKPPLEHITCVNRSRCRCRTLWSRFTCNGSWLRLLKSEIQYNHVQQQSALSFNTSTSFWSW